MWLSGSGPEGDCQDVFWRFLGDPTDAEMDAAVDLDAAVSGDVADEERPSLSLAMARLDALGAALAATRSIRDEEAAGRALDANLAALRAIRRVLDHAVRAEGDWRASGVVAGGEIGYETVTAAVRRRVVKKLCPGSDAIPPAPPDSGGPVVSCVWSGDRCRRQRVHRRAPPHAVRGHRGAHGACRD